MDDAWRGEKSVCRLEWVDVRKGRRSAPGERAECKWVDEGMVRRITVGGVGVLRSEAVAAWGIDSG